ncbi:zinc/cadmium resistance protein isoform X2 [Mugil cephalus]|uniref:zinc/cadmium resistance protein isoform X2 n=1 Tax=Mugil cephalus TaxID=48193 RepID=UPI001FB66E63|nr:zinc/cadmium resistance protein isoform X2 [Mugil cephalus]
MRVLHWCMLGVTLLLLMCEVAVSQLCMSLITLVDGFHTLFIAMRMALRLPEAEVKPSICPPRDSSSLAVRLPTPPASIKPLPASHTVTKDSATSDQLSPAQPDHDSASQVNSHQLVFPQIPPAATNCGMCYTDSRIQAVGIFISTLLLASLCTSYMIEIISFSLEPHPVQRPLLLVVVGAVSLLYKMLLFVLQWDQEERVGGSKQPESYPQVHHTVSAEQESVDWGESKETRQSKVQSAAEDSLQGGGGALVLCNPGTSSVPGTDSETPQQEMDVHPDDCEEQTSVKDLECESRSEDAAESHKYNTSYGQKSSHHVERPVPCGPWPVCVFSFIFVIQGLFTSFLALTNSVVMLLLIPQFPHSTETCSLLVYLDPALSLLGVITLLATTLPQVYRYGLLLLQATPPQVCVSDLGRRIASVPGVQAVHDLHIWQLTESLIVASVHVHCYASFPAHRCADLISGVTKVLQSVGVCCCTVQPEFTSCSGSSTDGGGDACPVVHREDPSSPPLLACSLSCGKACAGNMCCSLLEETTHSRRTPLPGEPKEEAQTLVIENTFV